MTQTYLSFQVGFHGNTRHRRILLVQLLFNLGFDFLDLGKALLTRYVIHQDESIAIVAQVSRGRGRFDPFGALNSKIDRLYF